MIWKTKLLTKSVKREISIIMKPKRNIKSKMPLIEGETWKNLAIEEAETTIVKFVHPGLLKEAVERTH